MGRRILAAGSIVSAAGRERIKRAMGIGEPAGENDLNRNAYHIERYIVVHGNKYLVTETGNQYCAQVVPGRYTYGATIESLRDNAQWSLDRVAEEAISVAAS
jgi:hypothetical protein